MAALKPASREAIRREGIIVVLNSKLYKEVIIEGIIIRSIISYNYKALS